MEFPSKAPLQTWESNCSWGGAERNHEKGRRPAGLTKQAGVIPGRGGAMVDLFRSARPAQVDGLPEFCAREPGSPALCCPTPEAKQSGATWLPVS